MERECSLRRTVHKKMQKINYLDSGMKEKNLFRSQGPISEVHVVRPKYLFTSGCFFSLSLWRTGNLAKIPWWHHNRVGVATLHKPKGLLTLHCATMRSEEGSFFHSTKEWFFTRPVRTAANNELSGPWYHVRFHTRQLHSGAEQKGAVRETFVGRERRCPEHAMRGEFDALQCQWCSGD